MPTVIPRLAAVVAMLLLLLSARTETARAQSPEALVIRDVNIVPMDREGVLRGFTIIVQNGVIHELGPADSVSIPAVARIIEGQGRYVLPGLADMHIHVEPGIGTVGDRAWRQMALLVSNGVTTARSLAGAGTGLQLRDAIRTGRLVGPALYLAGPSLNHQSVKTPEAARTAVLQQAQAGYEFIKTHGVSSEVYDAIVDAVAGTRLRLSGHVVPDYGLDRALAAGQQIEHLDGYLAAAIPVDAPVERPADQLFYGPELDYVRIDALAALAERTVQANVWSTPTLALFELAALPDPAQYRAWPEMRFVADELVEEWVGQLSELAAMPGEQRRRQSFVELRRAMTRALRDAGAGILAGSDSPQLFMVSGFALHRELQALQAAGLTPWQALATATVNPARYLGDNTFGVVAPGRRADLLLVDANPLDDVAHVAQISGVVLNGRWLSATDLRELQQQAGAAR